MVLLLAAGFVKHLATASTAYRSREFGVAFEYAPWQIKPILMSTVSSAAAPLQSIFAARGVVDFSVAAKRESVELSALDPSPYLRAASSSLRHIRADHRRGTQGIRAKYSYLNRSANSVDGLPEIIWACADIVPSKNYTYVFTMEGTPADFREQEKLYRSILDSVQWTNRPTGKTSHECSLEKLCNSFGSCLSWDCKTNAMNQIVARSLSLPTPRQDSTKDWRPFVKLAVRLRSRIYKDPLMPKRHGRGRGRSHQG